NQVDAIDLGAAGVEDADQRRMFDRSGFLPGLDLVAGAGRVRANDAYDGVAVLEAGAVGGVVFTEGEALLEPVAGQGYAFQVVPEWGRSHLQVTGRNPCHAES